MIKLTLAALFFLWAFFIANADTGAEVRQSVRAFCNAETASEAAVIFGHGTPSAGNLLADLLSIGTGKSF